MASFAGAVEVGAHALETDIHLTKDNEVVLSHVSRLEDMRCRTRLKPFLGCNPQKMLRQG